MVHEQTYDVNTYISSTKIYAMATMNGCVMASNRHARDDEQREDGHAITSIEHEYHAFM